MSEALLIDGLRGQSEMARARLVRAHWRRIVRFLVGQFSMSPEDAEEIANDALLKALNNIHRYDSRRSALPTWLNTIAKRIAINRWRWCGQWDAYDLPAGALESHPIGDESPPDPDDPYDEYGEFNWGRHTWGQIS